MRVRVRVCDVVFRRRRRKKRRRRTIITDPLRNTKTKKRLRA